MIIHVAIFKWKSGTSDSDVNNILSDLKIIKEECEGVIDIFHGTNFSKHNKGYEHAVVVLAKDQHGLDEYRNHPKHVTLAEKVDEIEEDGIGFDFENYLNTQ